MQRYVRRFAARSAAWSTPISVMGSSSNGWRARGEGRRGGFRTVIAYRVSDRAVFLFGFAKSDQANLSQDDERDLKDYGALLLALDAGGIGKMLAAKELTEVDYGEQA